jgi:hypothetical protein
MVDLTKRHLVTRSALAILLLAAIGCNQRAQSNGRKAGTHLSGYFLTIEWSGASTKLFHAVGFATVDRERELRIWVDENPVGRKGEVISEHEAHRLEVLLSSKQFLARRTTLEFVAHIQQYVIVNHSGPGPFYYQVGRDASTVTYVTSIQAVLDRPAAACLERIIADLAPTS